MIIVIHDNSFEFACMLMPCWQNCCSIKEKHLKVKLENQNFLGRRRSVTLTANLLTTVLFWNNEGQKQRKKWNNKYCVCVCVCVCKAWPKGIKKTRTCQFPLAILGVHVDQGLSSLGLVVLWHHGRQLLISLWQDTFLRLSALPHPLLRLLLFSPLLYEPEILYQWLAFLYVPHTLYMLLGAQLLGAQNDVNAHIVLPQTYSSFCQAHADPGGGGGGGVGGGHSHLERVGVCGPIIWNHTLKNWSCLWTEGLKN